MSDYTDTVTEIFAMSWLGGCQHYSFDPGQSLFVSFMSLHVDRQEEQETQSWLQKKLQGTL